MGILLCVLSIITSCGIEVYNENRLRITQQHESLLPMQISSIFAQNGTFGLEHYTAKISDSIITLNRINDTTLVFITPKLSKGIVFLSLDVNNEKKSFQYTILESTPIADSKTYVSGCLSSLESDINAFLTIMETDSVLKDSTMREFAEFYIKKSKEEFSKLSPAELQQLSLIIQANQIFGTEQKMKSKYTSIFDNLYESFYEEDFDQVNNLYKYNGTQLWNVFGEMQALDNSFLSFPKFYGLTLKYIYYYLKTKHYKSRIEYLPGILKNRPEFSRYEKSNVKPDCKLVNAQTNSEPIISFTNNSSLLFKISSIYRNVNAKDVNSTETGIIELIKNFMSFKNNAEKANQSFLKDKKTEVPKELSSINEILSTQKAINSKFITVENISNKNVQLVSFNKTGFTMSLKFKTDQTTAQDFTFDIKYLNPGFASITQNFTAKLFLIEPFSIEKVSGDNQIGDLGTKLTNPIKVLIKDEAGNPFAGAKVNFTANNGGSVSQAQATTGADGTASVFWTLGSNEATQTLSVSAFKSDNTTALQDSPLIFTYCTCNSKYGSFTDSRDGHVYKTITIGTQTWMAENLAYLPVAASDPTVGLEDEVNWITKTSPYYYVNDLAKYGVLYNWNAALTAAPAGWHLPTKAEWSTLSTYLGGDAVSGDKLKSATGWSSPNTSATNSSCFTALPGGGRNSNSMEKSDRTGLWWSSTDNNNNYFWFVDLFSNYSILFQLNTINKYDGYSVRCVKD